MKLFIDTSNKKLILATLDHSDQISNFLIEDSNNDMVKNTIPKIEAFLKSQKLNINDIYEYLFTIGPGSFTGVKVAMNIISTMALTKSINSYRVIGSFKLIEDKKYDSTVIPFGKSKYYYKKVNKNKIKVITNDEYQHLKKVNDGYKNFKKETLQSKIDNKEFKVVKNLDKVKIKYLSAF